MGTVWAIARSPANADRLIAGRRPAALMSSDNGGFDWASIDVEFARDCVYVGTPRVTQICFDPMRSGRVWASVEIDGVYRSDDDGLSWRKCDGAGLVSEDVHGVMAIVADGRTRLFATTNKGLHVSEDGGDTWTLRLLDSPWQYTRAIVRQATPGGTLFLTNGNGPPGSTGRLMRSEDVGLTWFDAGLPATLNSTPWCVAVHPSAPDVVIVATNLGQLFRSSDGGNSWEKLEREFGEIRALLLHPKRVERLRTA